MKELEALNKMLDVVLAYRPSRKKKKKSKRSGKVNPKKRQKGASSKSLRWPARGPENGPGPSVAGL